MKSRRWAAIVALLFLAFGVAALVVTSLRGFPRGIIMAVLIAASVATLWEAVRRTGRRRTLLVGVSVVLFVGALVVLGTGHVLAEAIVAIALLWGSLAAARQAFRIRVDLPTAERPSRAVVVWNPRSGGGKAAAAHLDVEARKRGIEPIELKPGDDLRQLVLDAVANGADALAAAGGDGTQALVATIAAEHDLPFACIPAGTRNHFALDLGVNRDDVVGALDAFVDGGERRVDLAELNGRVFVNNVSLGLYAQAVQHEGYRDAKLQTVLDTMPEFIGAHPSGDHELRYEAPGDLADHRAIVVMVSNNSYRLGTLMGSGTRPSIDDGLLGVAVFAAPKSGGRPTWRQWTATEFEVTSDAPVPAGVDGEALVFEPPLRFTIRPGALRVRIAPHHPGASPAAGQPNGLVDTVRRLLHIVRAG